MQRRNGMTLVEVLVAIFVMGIGLLSILAMFPLGAVNMARSIKDDHSGHAVGNARAIAAAQNIRFDVLVTPNFNNPDPTKYADAPWDGPSYPVFVDPVGYLSYALGPDQKWIAANNTLGVPRCKLSFINTPQAMLKWCTLLDDINFGENGTPSFENGIVERGGGVSWAWFLRLPKAGVPSVCDMAIVVYNQRPLSAANLLGAKEVAYAGCTFNDPNQTQLVTVPWPLGAPKPQIKEGSWILDATPSLPVAGKLMPGNATFVRVVGIGDTIGQTVEIELAQPLRLPAGQASATLIVMDGVVDVFAGGAGWRPGGN